MPSDIAFQVHLLSQLQAHQVNDLNMFNQIMECVKKHAAHQCVNFATLEIMSRQQLLKELSKYYNLKFMQPTLHCIPLADGSVATVPIFNIKSLLLSFLNDPLCMRKENFAPDYDIFTGQATSPITHIDKVHSGSLWEPARHWYCGDDPNAFPLALICFYDKTNTDVHGSLLCAPFIVTSSFLIIEGRNDDANYMVLGYIPNLGLEKGTKQAVSSTMKVQDKHNCLHLRTEQIKKIHQEGGFWTTIIGGQVCVVVWIHFVAVIRQVTTISWVTIILEKLNEFILIVGKRW